MMSPSDPSLEELIQAAPKIADALERLSRGEIREVDAHLVAVERHHELEGTRTRTHCYFVRRDPTGAARVDALVEWMLANVIDYAIPRSRIVAAQEHWQRTGSSSQWTRLHTEARSLFADLSLSGECGELLLFLLAERVLRIPQVIAKMSLKTAANAFYHGADGIHASLDPASGVLSLYWGESKIHANPAGAITSCLATLAPYLLEPDNRHAKRRQDLFLLNSLADPNDPVVAAALRAYLDPDSVAASRVQYCGVCLVGFDCEAYACKWGSGIADAIQSLVAAELDRWKQHVRSRIDTEKLAELNIHCFCIPVPSVAELRAAFLRDLGLGPGNATVNVPA